MLKPGRLQQPDQWSIQIGNVALALGARGDLHRSIPEIKYGQLQPERLVCSPAGVDGGWDGGFIFIYLFV